MSRNSPVLVSIATASASSTTEDQEQQTIFKVTFPRHYQIEAEDACQNQAIGFAMYQHFLPRYMTERAQFCSAEGFYSYAESPNFSVKKFLDGLINNGLPEALAIAYIFGNSLPADAMSVVTQVNGRVLSPDQRYLRLAQPRGSYQNFLQRKDLGYASRDLNSFPILVVRNPASWPAHGVAAAQASETLRYGADVSRRFENLSANKIFIEKSYSLLLKFILTSGAEFSDVISKAQWQRECENEEGDVVLGKPEPVSESLRVTMTRYHMDMRDALTSALLVTPQFMTWFATLGTQVELLEKISSSCDESRVRFVFRQVSEVIQKKIDHILDRLSDQLLNIAPKLAFTVAGSSVESLYLFFAALRMYLKTNTVFFQKESGSFFNRLLNLADAINSASRMIYALSLQEISSEQSKAIEQIKEALAFLKFDGELCGISIAVSAKNSPEQLASELAEWFKQVNKDGVPIHSEAIEALHTRLLRASSKNRTPSERAVSALTSIADVGKSFVDSFWGGSAALQVAKVVAPTSSSQQLLRNVGGFMRSEPSLKTQFFKERMSSISELLMRFRSIHETVGAEAYDQLMLAILQFLMRMQITYHAMLNNEPIFGELEGYLAAKLSGVNLSTSMVTLFSEKAGIFPVVRTQEAPECDFVEITSTRDQAATNAARSQPSPQPPTQDNPQNAVVDCSFGSSSFSDGSSFFDVGDNFEPIDAGPASDTQVYSPHH